MSLYKKDIAKAIIVVSLVAVLSIGSYFLFPDALPKMMYAIGATIQDDASAAEDFIAGIRESGGAYISIASYPSMNLTFENVSVWFQPFRVINNKLFYLIHYTNRSGPLFLGTQYLGDEVIITNTSGLQEFNVNWGWERITSHPQSRASYLYRWGGYFAGSFSGKFENLLTGGSLDWYGNYNRGNEINTALYVDSNRTDLGACFSDNNPFVLKLHSNIIGNTTLTWVYGTYRGTSGPASWETGPCWGKNGWSMQIDQLLQMVGESKSASISFEGSVWVDGNYTAIENGTVRNETLNLKKNVSFGTIDVTFENGLISTLTFKLKVMDIILFTYIQK